MKAEYVRENGVLRCRETTRTYDGNGVEVIHYGAYVANSRCEHSGKVDGTKRPEIIHETASVMDGVLEVIDDDLTSFKPGHVYTFILLCMAGLLFIIWMFISKTKGAPAA